MRKPDWASRVTFPIGCVQSYCKDQFLFVFPGDRCYKLKHGSRFVSPQLRMQLVLIPAR